MENTSHEHTLSYKGLSFILFLLLVLTGITVAISRVDLGIFRIWAALAIASLKAAFVLLFFMHIIQAGKRVTITFITTILILAMFIGFTFFDIAYR